MEVLVNVTLSPCEGIGTLLKTLKHCFGMQAVSPETWLISPLNAFGEQEAVANTMVSMIKRFIICRMGYVLYMLFRVVIV